MTISVDSPLVILLLSMLLLISASKIFCRKRKTFPGPLGYPVVGNLFQLQEGHAKKLGQWTTQYGGIFTLVLGNRKAVVLNTHRAVKQTIVDQGVAFQSRPEFNLWHDVFSKALDLKAPSTLGTMKFSATVSESRRLLRPQLSQDKLQSYNHFFSNRFLHLMGLLSEISSKGPADIGFCIWTSMVGITTDKLVGEIVDEEMIKVIADTTFKVLRQRSLGAPFSDYLPILAFAKRITPLFLSPFLITHLPRLSAWLASLGDTETQAEALRRAEVNYCTQLLRELHQRLDHGDDTPSILGDLIRGRSKALDPTYELMMMTSLAGTGMTVGTTLVWLIGRLATLPEIQDRAFNALKTVYGDQSPDPLDTDHVEYIKALGLEAGRFFASIRLGFNREAYKDALVDGVLIPKGTHVIYNSFQINRDPLRYDYPDEFRPERWIGDNYGYTSPQMSAVPKIGVPHLTHGAGNRICMGIPTTNAMLYGTLTLVLYFFKLERAPLSEAAKKNIFPEFRAVKEASLKMDPVDDQVSACDAQAVPGYFGIKLTPRDPDALRQWMAEH